ncbi:MAG TPA: phosphoglycerate mutase family protein, partial [Ottowia sp.]|nr:phosphoglycerate mutase family protein [Ottowia sp.]
MGTLYLVRHGQASFGTDHYDQLSELGRRQSLRLGQYWRERSGAELAFDAVLTGTLARQVQTWQGIAEGAQLTGVPCVEWPGLNEYDSHAVISAVHPDPL